MPTYITKCKVGSCNLRTIKENRESTLDVRTEKINRFATEIRALSHTCNEHTPWTTPFVTDIPVRPALLVSKRIMPRARTQFITDVDIDTQHSLYSTYSLYTIYILSVTIVVNFLLRVVFFFVIRTRLNKNVPYSTDTKVCALFQRN